MRILVNGKEVPCEGAAVQFIVTAQEWRSMHSAVLQAMPIGNTTLMLPGGQRVEFMLVGVIMPAGKPHTPIL